MISLLGPPPPTLLARGTASSRFFSKDCEFPPSSKPSQTKHKSFLNRTTSDRNTTDESLAPGNLITTVTSPASRPFELRENVLEGEDRARFLRFVSKMLRWEPSERSQALELIDDEWIHGKN